MADQILIVDDEKDMLTLLKRYITHQTDYGVATESDPLKALQRFKRGSFELVITDLKMPSMDGIDLLREIKKIDPEISVVIITAYATIDTAVEAIKEGAYDYITKPFRRERILMTVEKVMAWRKVVAENLALREALAGREGGASIIGSTPAIQAVMEKIRQVAPTMATVLITGESGTGKELAAQAIYRYSQRKNTDFVTVNCTALSETVIESELFGHVKGAFTGAWKDKKGLVEIADGGTLFLDEIGDLSVSMQTKLLRLLQAGEYKPVGSSRSKNADIRYIAATNHCLENEIQEKRFREDLFYRLNVVRIELPPLRDRTADIPVLARHFLQKYALFNQKEIADISLEGLQALQSYHFPGNVRELENMIERSIIFCRTSVLEKKDLFGEAQPQAGTNGVNQHILSLPFKEAREKMMELFHAQYIRVLLDKNNGNISRAAEAAGIQRQYLHRLMKETGIMANEFKP
ncbi:MAG: sigma-54-dependent Fis family transcriptional regulator [Desulfobacterales bacterium]|nr:sigma-54-dependent Fis family transcriptional regulator [Desulfobacterales bacterium]